MSSVFVDNLYRAVLNLLVNQILHLPSWRRPGAAVGGFFFSRCRRRCSPRAPGFSPRGSRSTRAAVAGSVVKLRTMCESFGLCIFSGLHAVRSPPTSLELSSRHDHPSLVLPLLDRNVVQGLALVLWREDKRIMCCSDGLYAVVSLLCCATAADLPHTNHRNMRPERCGRQLRIFATQLSVLHSPP